MNTEQIEQLFRSDQVMSPKFGGLFSRDILPNLAEDVKFPCATHILGVLLAAAEGGEYYD